MQTTSAADILTRKTALSLNPRTRLEVVSRANPSDVRLVLDTADRSYDPERVGLVSGSVSVDTSRDVLRSLSLELVDWEGDWRPGAGRSMWVDAYVRVYRGYEQTTIWPQGVFIPSRPRSGHGRRVSISGQDKASRANGRPEGGFTQYWSIGKGVTVSAALKTLATDAAWGETDLNIPDTPGSVLPYDMTWGLTDKPWDAARKIASIPGNYRSLHYDESGRLTFILDPDPGQLTPVWDVWHEAGRPTTALAGEFSSFIRADLESDTDQLINWVGVKGGSAQNGLYSSVVMDSDPNSPTSVNRIGYRMFWWNNGNPDPLIASQADADNRALYEYRQRKRWQEQVPLTMEELPFLQPWDVLRIRNPEIALDDNYQITAYTVPLDVPPSYRGEMQATGWKVRT